MNRTSIPAVAIITVETNHAAATVHLALPFIVISLIQIVECIFSIRRYLSCVPHYASLISNEIHADSTED